MSHSTLDRDAAEALLARVAGRRVVILGDLMVDRFIWGTVDRISPEAPVPVVRVLRESTHPGGAGNVVTNIAALAGEPLPVGVVGADEAGAGLRESMALAGVFTGGLIEAAGRSTTVKTRIVAHSQQVVRFDRESDEPVDAATIAALGARALELCREAGALVVSDYEKGTISAALLEKVLPEAHRLGLPIVIDGKPGAWRNYRPCTAITPNQTEAARMSGRTIRSDKDAVAAAGAIREALGCRGVLLTRGDRGMLLVEEGAAVLPIPTAARAVYDVTGAGDTVVAALALCLAAGASLAEAALVANAAAGVVVGKVGTATATAQEVLASF